MKKIRALFYSLIVAAWLLTACSPAVTTTPATTIVSIIPTAQTAGMQNTASPVATPAAAAQSTATTNSAPASGNPPAGTPPGGNPPGGGTGSTSAAEALASATGAYTLDGGTATETDKTYTASNTDESGVYVINGGTLTLINPTVTTTGNTSSSDLSSFYGLNAGILAASGSAINVTGGTIDTTGTGANGAFATGAGSVVTLSNVTITAANGGGHGVMATNGGTVTLTDVDMTTAGANSGAIATDRGSGTITALRGTVTTSGADSPAVYSTGMITVTDATLTATGAEAAVMEGANSIVLINDTLSSSVANKWGVMIYQSSSGDAEGSEGTFIMSGGSLAYTSATGPLFYVTNSTGLITLKGVNVAAASSELIRAEGNDRWGTSGANGGTVVLTADGQTLTGNFSADKLSSISATLQNGSSLTGAINKDKAARAANLSLDAASTWTVTADSYLSCLSDAAGISGSTLSNINGNGYTVYYNPSACAALNSQTYTLNGSGALKPIN